MSTEVVRDTQTVVRVGGEIDLSNVSELRAALDEAVALAPKGFIIDLTDTMYIDSAGVHAILRAYVKMRDSQGSLALVVGNPRIKSMLQVVHLEQLPQMTVCDDLRCAQEKMP